MASLLSTVTVTTIGLTCKAFLNSGLCSISISGLSTLLEALSSDERRNGRGIITVSNHLSTLDDPVAWGILPARLYLNPRTTRWTLGASDIMFTNPVFSGFFRNGQVLETFRGKGIYQPAVDSAIAKLNEGDWVHLFGEGKVNQSHTYALENGIGYLPRFKWGVGRIVIEADVPPLIIPMWLTGFDKLMPEHRPFPRKYFPRLGVNLSVTFGAPLPSEEITNALGIGRGNRILCHERDALRNTTADSSQEQSNWPVERGSDRANPLPHASMEEMDFIRSKVTAVVQRAVESLGRSVSGETLNGAK